MDGNKKMALLGSAPIPKALLALGIPTMIGMLINALYNLVDTYFVGGLGTDQMGAVTVAFPLGQIVVRCVLIAPAQQPGQIGGSAVSEQQAQANNNLSQGKGNRDRAHLVGSQPAYKIGIYQIVKGVNEHTNHRWDAQRQEIGRAHV